MRLKEMRLQGLEEMSRKVSRCVQDGFFEDLRFKLLKPDFSNTGCMVDTGNFTVLCLFMY